MNIFQTLNRLGVLSTARRPEWKTPAITEVAPTNPASGVALSGAVKCLVEVALREDTHRHTARVTLGELDIVGTTYRVTVDGFNVDVAGDTDLETTLEELAAAINDDGDAGGVVVASVEDGEVVLRGRPEGEGGPGEAAYPVAVSVQAGSGTISVTADATTASVRIYLWPDGIANQARLLSWKVPPGGVFESLDVRGLTERATCSGFSRIYVEVFDADGEVRVAVGPGVME